MPLYPIACNCGYTGDIYQTVAQLTECDGKLECPWCHKMCDQDYSAKNVALAGSCIMFTGTKRESITEGFHPKEVERARRVMGDDLGGCIQDDGTVRFRDRDQRTKWDQKKDETRAKSQDRRAASAV